MGEEMIILSIRPCGTYRVILQAVKSYDMGPSRFTSHPRGRCAADFIALKKSIALAGFEPATFMSTNHSSDVRWKIFHRKFSRTENFPQYFSRKFSVS
jgi:hypothetical protein